MNSMLLKRFFYIFCICIGILANSYLALRAITGDGFPVCSPLQLFPSMVWASGSNQLLWGRVEQETNYRANQRSTAQ